MAEGRAAAKTERENEDVRRRAREQKGELEIAKAREILSAVGNGLSTLLSEDGLGRLGRLCGALLVVVAGGFAAKEASRVARTRLLAILGRPSLVRETTALSPFTAPLDAAKKIAKRMTSSAGSRGADWAEILQSGFPHHA